ncbi:MAG: transposase [Verrucomicrobiota bacterium]|jgi:transposase
MRREASGKRASEGGRRRVFSADFKPTQVQRILTGEKTLAELKRELDISPSVVRNWKRQFETGGPTAVAANKDVVPASQLQEVYARIRELERLLGCKQMEVEILQAAQEVVKKVRGCTKGPDADRASDEPDLPRARPALLDIDALAANPRAHRATRVASDVIGRTA